MPVYAVTGASGHLGRFAIEQLLARGVPRRRRGAQPGQGHPPSRAWRAGARGGPFTPETLGAALAGVNRPLVSAASSANWPPSTPTSSRPRTAGVSRIVCTSMLNADDSTSPLAGEHRDTERALRDAGVPFTLLRNGYYTEGYTDPLGQSSKTARSSAPPATARCRRPAARTTPPPPRQHALRRRREPDLRTRRPGFRPPPACRVISEVTGTKVTYRNLPAGQYAGALQQSGLDESTARFVAALDASIAAATSRPAART